MKHHFRIRLALEFRAGRFKLRPQCAEILDNPVMHHSDTLCHVRMRIRFGWLAMRRPPRMPDRR